MAEKRMIFTAESVRAMLGGMKSQTRRVVEPQPEPCAFELYHKCGLDEFFYDKIAQSLYCQACGRPLYYDKQLKKRTVKKRYEAPCNVGDIIYVKEAWTGPYADTLLYGYKADYIYKPGYVAYYHKWRSPLYMPRAAARIFLRVTDVRVERLQEITEADAKAEGIRSYFLHKEHGGEWHESNGTFVGVDNTYPTRKQAYSEHWDEINGKRDKGAYKWENNPFVWVYTFERVLNYEY